VIVVSVDALDEYNNNDDVSPLIRCLAAAGAVEHVDLRIFVTSRQDQPISIGFGDISADTHQDVMLHDIEQSIVDQDLAVFWGPDLGRGAAHAGNTGDFVLERMRGSTSATGQVTFSFDIEVNYGGGDGGKQGVRRERFEWGKVEKGTDDTAKEGGHDKRIYHAKSAPSKTVICMTRKLPSAVSLSCLWPRAAAAALASATERVEGAPGQPSTF